MNRMQFFSIFLSSVIFFGSINAMESSRSSQRYTPEELENVLQEATTKEPNIGAPLPKKDIKRINAETKKFIQSFNYEDSGRFLRENLKYDPKNPIAYISKLRAFAHTLYFQHLFLQLIEDFNFNEWYRNDVIDDLNEIGRALGKIISLPSGHILAIPKVTDPRDLAVLIKYNNLLNDPKSLFEKRTFSVIKTFLYSSSFKLRCFGKFHKITRDSMLAQEKDKEYKTRIGLFFDSKYRQTYENKPFEALYYTSMLSIFSNWWRYYAQIKEQVNAGVLDESTETSAEREFRKNNRYGCLVYAELYLYYQKLYNQILAELIWVIGSIENNDLKDRLRADQFKVLPLYAELFAGLKALPDRLPIFKKANKNTVELVSINQVLRDVPFVHEEFEQFLPQPRRTDVLPASAAAAVAADVATKVFEDTSPPSSKAEEPVIAAEPQLITENDDLVTIINPTHETVEYIFKINPKLSPEQLGLVVPLKYSPNVREWFDDPASALKKQGYFDNTNPRYKYRYECPWLPEVEHCFSKEIDTMLLKWGHVTFMPNNRYPGRRDIHIKIPGMIIYPKNMKKYPNGKTQKTGYFHYIIDQQNNECFHRFFVAMKPTEFIQCDWQNEALKNVEFPALPSKITA